jgi:hypothetical protein
MTPKRTIPYCLGARQLVERQGPDMVLRCPTCGHTSKVTAQYVTTKGPLPARCHKCPRPDRRKARLRPPEWLRQALARAIEEQISLYLITKEYNGQKNDSSGDESGEMPAVRGAGGGGDHDALDGRDSAETETPHDEGR